MPKNANSFSPKVVLSQENHWMFTQVEEDVPTGTHGRTEQANSVSIKTLKTAPLGHY